MAGSVPCLPSTPDSPVVLSGIGNELRTDLILSGQNARGNWPGLYPPATNALADGGNPLRLGSADGNDPSTGMWAPPYPFHKAGVVTGGGQAREGVALTPTTITNFYTPLTLGISNPGPYTIQGALLHNFAYYLGGQDPQMQFLARYETSGGASLSSVGTVNQQFQRKVADSTPGGYEPALERQDLNHTLQQFPRLMTIPPRTNITVTANVDLKTFRAVPVNATTISGTWSQLVFTGGPVS